MRRHLLHLLQLLRLHGREWIWAARQPVSVGALADHAAYGAVAAAAVSAAATAAAAASVILSLPLPLTPPLLLPVPLTPPLLLLSLLVAHLPPQVSLPRCPAVPDLPPGREGWCSPDT